MGVGGGGSAGVGGGSVGVGGGGSVGVGVPPHAARITAAPSRRTIASHSGHFLENLWVTMTIGSPFLFSVFTRDDVCLTGSQSWSLRPLDDGGQGDAKVRVDLRATSAGCEQETSPLDGLSESQTSLGKG